MKAISDKSNHLYGFIAGKPTSNDDGKQWHLTLRPARHQSAQQPKSWSRYEKLSFLMLFWMFGVMTAMTLFLHLLNYDRETKTSSTSGTHRTFYGLHGADKEAPSASPTHSQNTTEKNQTLPHE